MIGIARRIAEVTARAQINRYADGRSTVVDSIIALSAVEILLTGIAGKLSSPVVPSTWTG